MDSEVFAISQELMAGHGDLLFDHIAKCLAEFAKSRGIDGEVLPLGFTFSFPCKQKGLAVGELIKWTKGFKCEGNKKQNHFKYHRIFGIVLTIVIHAENVFCRC